MALGLLRVHLMMRLLRVVALPVAAAASLVQGRPATAGEATRSVVAQDSAIAGMVAVRDVHRQGSDVVCELVNLTDETLEDVRLVVSDEFRWANEFAPGADDPSRVRILVFSRPIPPRGQATVRATFPPRPQRADGHFEPRVDVVGLERWSKGGPLGIR